MNKPGISDWKKLYQLAIEFYENEPWTWMGNDDLFAVENPENGEVGYCCILGAAGEEFGLGVMLGESGYQRYLEVLATDAGADDFEKRISVPLFSFLFVSRQEMAKEELELIRSLGLKFRGKKAWPYFRSQKPGCVPWYLEKDEVRFMITLLERALFVAEKVGSGRLDLFEKVDEEKIFTCFYRNGKWQTEWRTPVVPAETLPAREQSLTAVNEAELLLVQNSAGKPKGNWEFDIFSVAAPVISESGRPYYPLYLMAVETGQGMILAGEMAEPWISLAEKRNLIIQILKKVRPLPRKIKLRTRETEEILQPIAESLGIDLSLGKLPILAEARKALEDYLKL